MPSVLKPLFRPETLRERLRGYALPDALQEARQKLIRQARYLASTDAHRAKESTLFPAFFAEVFGDLLGYVSPAQGEITAPATTTAAAATAGTTTTTTANTNNTATSPSESAPLRYTFAPAFPTPKGEFADAAIGRNPARGVSRSVTAVVEMKGPSDPLDIPHAGRRLSAVEQAFGYAIDIPCDWIIVSSMVETRLYCKRADRLSCERFLISRLADPHDDSQLRKFVYLLAAERLVPQRDGAPSHLDEILEASRETGADVTSAFYADYSQMREKAFFDLARTNPDIPRPELLSATQKLLDRILFCAFSEDRDLLPSNTILHAYTYIDPYSEPRPRWDNFRALFRAIDKGNPALGISRYNGGLFAPDPLLDQQLVVPDTVCDLFRRLGEYEYRALDPADPDFPDSPPPPAYLDVEILGHIFEQSITDLERFRERLAADPDAITPPEPKKAKTRRKKEGAFYTPSYITRFLVRESLGSVLRERFDALAARQRENATAPVRKALVDPRAYNVDELKPAPRAALHQFWSDWRTELGRIRILDPACGSGAFLIEAFDQLLAEYQTANEHYSVLAGQPEFLDLNRLILQQNLYGVDLNAEAVEICRLSLWIKTAEKGKILADLDHTLQVGNSLIDDDTFAPGKAFDWETAFPEVFADGGFDVVIGNPPYIRQEWIAPLKPYLKARYQIYSGTADLYLYFVEKGLKVLKSGGRLGFITSGTFTRGSFATEFRQWLPGAARFQVLVNFGENQPFADAEMVYPTMYVLEKTPTPASFPALFIADKIPDAIEEAVVTDAVQCENEAVFEQSEWKFQPRAVTELFNKLMNTGRPLREACEGRMYRGVLTGLNEAFIIDQATRDRLVAEDPNSETILKKVLKGEDLRPWYQDWEGRWLIFARRGITIEQYPAVLSYLEQYREQLEPRPADWKGKPDQWPGRKPGSYPWYELQDSIDYFAEFEQPKILWPDIAKLPRFSWDKDGFSVNDKGYIAVPGSPAILATLTTRLSWFCISQMCLPLRLRGGLWQSQCKLQFVEQTPIPLLSSSDEKILTDLALTATETARARHGLHTRVRHRIETDLSSVNRPSNTALSSWWNLDFRSFRAEVKKSFAADIPLSERDAWEAQHAAWKSEHDSLTRRLIDLEQEINSRTNHLFALTPSEIQTLEAFQKHTRTFYPLGET